MVWKRLKKRWSCPYLVFTGWSSCKSDTRHVQLCMLTWDKSSESHHAKTCLEIEGWGSLSFFSLFVPRGVILMWQLTIFKSSGIPIFKSVSYQRNGWYCIDSNLGRQSNLNVCAVPNAGWMGRRVWQWQMFLVRLDRDMAQRIPARLRSAILLIKY